MPWWERRMWVEKLGQHLAPEEQPQDGEGAEAGQEPGFEAPDSVSDDASAFGITPESLA